MEERKRRDFDGHGDSHTPVFSIGWEHPRATALVQPSLVWEPPRQQNELNLFNFDVFFGSSHASKVY